MRIGFFLIAGAFLCLILTSCSPVKGYEGPELPDEQIALVTYATPTDSVVVQSASMNGISFSSAGIKILPGTHRFTMNVVVKDPPDNCYTYPQFDHSGYQQCLDKNKRTCDCFSFLSVYKKCFRQVRDGSCDGKITTKAGKQYQVGVSQDGRSAELAIIENTGGKSSGKGDCAVYGQRTEEEEEYVGSGRSTAQSYGYYRCY